MNNLINFMGFHQNSPNKGFMAFPHKIYNLKSRRNL